MSHTHTHTRAQHTRVQTHKPIRKRTRNRLLIIYTPFYRTALTNYFRVVHYRVLCQKPQTVMFFWVWPFEVWSENTTYRSVSANYREFSSQLWLVYLTRISGNSITLPKYPRSTPPFLGQPRIIYGVVRILDRQIGGCGVVTTIMPTVQQFVISVTRTLTPRRARDRSANSCFFFMYMCAPGRLDLLLMLIVVLVYHVMKWHKPCYVLTHPFTSHFICTRLMSMFYRVRNRPCALSFA